jgi:hypothetical protein
VTCDLLGTFCTWQITGFWYRDSLRHKLSSRCRSMTRVFPFCVRMWHNMCVLEYNMAELTVQMGHHGWLTMVLIAGFKGSGWT